MLSPALLGLSIFTGRKSWQAAGQAYILPKQNGAYLVESSARPKGLAFLLHKEQHQHLWGLSSRRCCDLLILCWAEAHSILHCLGPALTVCHPRSLVPLLCSSLALQPLHCRSLPCPRLSRFSILVKVRPKLYPGSCRRQLSPTCPIWAVWISSTWQVRTCSFAHAFHNESPQRICLDWHLGSSLRVDSTQLKPTSELVQKPSTLSFLILQMSSSRNQSCLSFWACL